MGNSIEESLAGFLDGEAEVASFVDIKHDENYREFTVYIDMNQYTAFDQLYIFAFYLSSVYYQMFEGVEPDDIDVLVEYIDNETKEVITSGSYKEYMQSLEENEGN